MRKIACEVCAVRPRSLIADVPVGRLGDFPGATMVYKPRQVLFHEATPADGLYIVCDGSVKLYVSDRFGRDHILGVVMPGDVVGELPFDDDATYSTSAEALTALQVRHLPRVTVERLLEMEPSVGLRLIGLLSKALSGSRRKTAGLALKPADARMAELLIELAGPVDAYAAAPPRITLAYSRRDLAEMIGVSTETAIRLLTRLKQRGILCTNGRELEITDFAALSRLATRNSLAG